MGNKRKKLELIHFVYVSLKKKTDVNSESQTTIFTPLALRKKICLGFPNCSSTQTIQSSESLADVGRKCPSRRQRRRMVQRDDMFKVASRHRGNRANNELCDVLQDLCNHCRVGRRISDRLCHATSRSESNIQILFITPPRPPVSSQQLHYKVSLAQDWNLRHNLQSALLI